MQTIKSHWRLAYVSFIKAIKVTFKTIISMIKSKLYSVKVKSLSKNSIIIIRGDKNEN